MEKIISPKYDQEKLGIQNIEKEEQISSDEEDDIKKKPFP